MANQDPLSGSDYLHHAFAFGVSGQIDRPVAQTIPTQASVSLSPTGGQGSHRIEKFQIPGIVSFGAANVNVGGSFDRDHKTHTTYSCSVIEDLDICGMITADRVVARLTIYHPSESSESSTEQGPSFSTVGSYFENLRIAGQRIEVKLATRDFHDSTYTSFCEAGGITPHPKGKWLVGHGIDKEKLKQHKKLLGHNYGIVKSLADRFAQWDPKGKQPTFGTHHRCSPANLLDLASTQGPEPALVNFGSIICVPRFGVVSLAELLVYHHHRHLTMIRVQLCSPAGGFIDSGGGGGGGGGSMPPG